jgi:spermidine synthase
VKKTPAPGVEATLTSGQRRYLYCTAALTGACIMVVEILGAKMLSPYVGTSHFVWTAQITVTLVALAAGYYAGGKLVDRSQSLGRLYGCILAAALYLAATVGICSRVAYACLQFDLAVGSLLAASFLFFVPLALLATVGPFVVRVLTQAVASVGGTMGRLTAISTLGSVAGTILIGYVLIPFLPNSLTMYFVSLALMLVCAGYFVIWQRQGKSLPVAAAVVLAGAVAGWFGSRPESPDRELVRELYRGNSNFGLMQVFDAVEGSTRYYLNDYLTQNNYDPEQKKSKSLFTYMLHGLAHAYTTNVSDVLCIGLGVGIVPMEFAREGARVDVVEINPAVLPLGRTYFNLKPEMLHITFGDGRYFLNECQKQYDAVILDAFLGDSSPSHLMTREAFQAVRRVLKPGGVLVINSFGNFEPGHDFFTASLHKTLKDVFAGVRIHSNRGGNVLFVAAARPLPDFVNPPNLAEVHASVRRVVEAAYASVMDTNPDHGRVLTDDFNPVEFYDAKNRESIRKNLAFSMKPSRAE